MIETHNGESKFGSNQSLPENQYLLTSINDPKDLNKLTYAELEELAAELRAMIIAIMSRNGGHLASSLGAVEIILALHRVFSSKDDDIVFDVGHQTLAHKLLTGRLDRISTLRQFNGISGFPRRSESDHDVYDSGHASDSLSIAIGLLIAKRMSHNPGEVAVMIGDASITGGLSFEALNHIGQEGKNLIIVLNDNGMSISKNVGAISLFLGKIRLSEEYKFLRNKVEHRVESLGNIGRIAVEVGENVKNSFKKLLVGGTFFEDLGITYIGPIDGHNIESLEQAMIAAKNTDGPVLIHAVTVKGLGYKPAEERPEVFHGVGGFDIETGELAKSAGSSGFTKVFGKLMTLEGRKNPDLVAISAAMGDGTGLIEFAQKFPKRFFDVGISEEHAVTLSAGLALGHKMPVVAIYSTFLQRAYDQIMINGALQKLHIVFCIDRAGIVGRDGSTHHGLFDIAYLRSMPNMTILAPSSTEELAGAFRCALHELDGPVAIRYPRSAKDSYEPTGDEEPWEIGKAVCVQDGQDVAILALGRMVEQAKEAAEILAKKDISCAIYDMRWAKPIDQDCVIAQVDKDLIVTIEEGTLCGGYSNGVLEILNGCDRQTPKVIQFGIDDDFVTHGSEDELFEMLGLTGQNIAKRIEDEYKARKKD